jgi:hypothetical protein
MISRGQGECAERRSWLVSNHGSQVPGPKLARAPAPVVPMPVPMLMRRPPLKLGRLDRQFILSPFWHTASYHARYHSFEAVDVFLPRQHTLSPSSGSPETRSVLQGRDSKRLAWALARTHTLILSILALFVPRPHVISSAHNTPSFSTSNAFRIPSCTHHTSFFSLFSTIVDRHTSRVCQPKCQINHLPVRPLGPSVVAHLLPNSSPLDHLCLLQPLQPPQPLPVYPVLNTIEVRPFRRPPKV